MPVTRRKSVRTGGTSFVRAFGSAPRSSSTWISSRNGARSMLFTNVPLSTSMLRVSTAAHSGVRPYQSTALMSAPRSIRIARDVGMVVRDGGDERRDVVGVALIDVGAGVEQHPHGLHPAVARRVQQRRHRRQESDPAPAIGRAAADDADAVTEAGHGIGQHPRGRPSGARPRIDRRAARDREASRCRDGSRGRRPSAPSADTSASVASTFGAAVEQQRDRIERPDARRAHQRRLAGRIGRVRIGAGVEQDADHRGVAVGWPRAPSASPRIGWRASPGRPRPAAAAPSRHRRRARPSAAPATRPCPAR